MAFGVRKNTPGGDIYACPLCDYVTADQNAFINHLVNVHGMNPGEARALVRAS